MKRKLFVLLLAVVVLGGLAYVLGDRLSIEQLAEQEERLRARIAGDPWRWFVIGAVGYTIVSLVPGTSGKALIVGWLYGYWRGVLIVLIGLTIAAMATFWLSRYVLREALESKFRTILEKLNRALEKDGAIYLLTLRMAHAPYSWVNYTCGASRINAWTFCWTTTFGLLPGTLVFVYVGANLPTLRELSGRGATSFVDPPIIIALVVMAAFPFTTRWLLRRFTPWFQRPTGRETAPGSS